MLCDEELRLVTPCRSIGINQFGLNATAWNEPVRRWIPLWARCPLVTIFPAPKHGCLLHRSAAGRLHLVVLPAFGPLPVQVHASGVLQQQGGVNPMKSYGHKSDGHKYDSHKGDSPKGGDSHKADFDFDIDAWIKQTSNP